MAYILDSHALLWFLDSGALLSPRVSALIADERNRIFVSPVSVYELEYKSMRGKLAPAPRELIAIIAQVGFEELPVSARAAEVAARIPAAHRDPWDRILAGQAIFHRYGLISRDREIAKLGVQTIW